jgi:hypothetical protein
MPVMRAPNRPHLLRAVRSRLTPAAELERRWQAWPQAPPPAELQQLLDTVIAGHGLYFYQLVSNCQKRWFLSPDTRASWLPCSCSRPSPFLCDRTANDAANTLKFVCNLPDVRQKSLCAA